MGRAYLCPHCRARNRFQLDDNSDGVVCCGACHGTFLLPEYADSSSAWSRDDDDTSIVKLDKKAENVQSLPTVGGLTASEPRSEAPTIASLDNSSLPTPSSENVTSRLPTVGNIAMDDIEDPRSKQETLKEVDALSANTTLVVSDTQPELDRQSEHTEPDIMQPTPTGGTEDNDDETDHNTAVNEEASTASEQKSSAAITNVSALEQETQPDLYAGDIDETEAEQLATHTELQIEDNILDRPLSATTVREFDPNKMRPWYAVALLIAISSGIAVYVIGNRNAQEAEGRLVSLAVERAKQQVHVANQMLSTVMNSGRPDLMRRVMTDLNNQPDIGLTIIRPNRTQAFKSNDMSTYRSALARICANKDTEQKMAEKWLDGNDPIVSALGASPCKQLSKLSESQNRILSNLNEAGLKAAVTPPIRPKHWLKRDNGRSEHVYVSAIMNDGTCAGCHANEHLGWTVVQTDLSAIDTLQANTRQSTLLVTGATLLIVSLLLLGGMRLVYRKEITL